MYESVGALRFTVEAEDKQRRATETPGRRGEKEGRVGKVELRGSEGERERVRETQDSGQKKMRLYTGSSTQRQTDIHWVTNTHR